METFFLAISFIIAAGVLPFLFLRSSRLMRGSAVIMTAAGGLTGLLFAARAMTTATPPAATFLLPGGLRVLMQVDAVSAFFLLPIFLVAPVAALYSFHYTRAQGPRAAAGYLFFSLLTAAMAAVVCAADITGFIIAWELMSISSFFLVIHDFGKKESRRAGYIYLLFAQAGAMVIFATFALAYGKSGSLDFASFATMPAQARILVFVLAFIGFGSKAGIIPLHTWLPHAHPAAESHVSALMSGVMIKMGIYGMVRFYAILRPPGPGCAMLLILTGAVTGVLGVVLALGQHDLKRLLAYHSVENIGIIVLGLGIGMLGAATGHPLMALLGFAGGLLHVLNHALFKSLLFMGAGSVQRGAATLNIEQLGGLMKRMPLSGTCFLAGSLAICGLPPFNGFVSEFLVYSGGFQGVANSEAQMFTALAAVISLAVIGGLAVACFTKVVGVVFLGEPRSEKAKIAPPAGRSMQAAMVLLAVACLGIGLGAPWFIALARRAAGPLLATPTPMPAPLDTAAYAIALAAAGFLLLLAILAAGRGLLAHGRPAESATWGCGFSSPTPRMQYTGSSFAAEIVGFYRPFVIIRRDFSGIHGLFPPLSSFRSHTIDLVELGIRRWLARSVMALTGKIRWLQHGHIQLYIAYIFFAMLGLLLWLMV